MSKIFSSPREIVDPQTYEGEIGIVNGKNNPTIATLDPERNIVVPVEFNESSPECPVSVSKFRKLLSENYSNLIDTFDLRIDLGDKLGIPKKRFGVSENGLPVVIKDDASVVGTEIVNNMNLGAGDTALTNPGEISTVVYNPSQYYKTDKVKLPNDVVTDHGKGKVSSWLRAIKQSMEYSASKMKRRKLDQDMEIYLYNTSEKIIDIPSKRVYIDLIKYGDDIYTDSLDIRDKFSNLASPGLKGILEVEVSYVKTGQDKIFTHNTIFPAFVYPKDENLAGNLEIPERLELIGGNDLSLEYFGGLLRLIRHSTDLREYVITKCTLSYGD